MITEFFFLHKCAEKILPDCYAFVQFFKWLSYIRKENKVEQTLATWWSNVDCFANLFSHLPFVHLKKNCKNFVTIRNPNCFNYTKGSERKKSPMDLLVQIGIITMKKRNPNEPLSKTSPYIFFNHFVYLCWHTAGIFDLTNTIILYIGLKKMDQKQQITNDK